MKTNIILSKAVIATLVLSLSGCRFGGGGATTESYGKKKEVKEIKQIQNTFKKQSTLILEKPSQKILKDNNITLTLKDKSGRSIINNIEWITDVKNAIKPTQTNIINPKKDGTINIQAKHNNNYSNTIKLNVKWIVNGHKLPPEPDEKLNNSTLLGIDSNNNGVRDDVERWIYEEYKDKHPIYSDIFMQSARGYKKVLEMPKKALQIRLQVNSSMYCEWYYRSTAKYYNEPILVKREEMNRKYFEKIYFNTKARKKAYYEEYSKALSGHVLESPKSEDEKSYCDFNTSKYDK